MYHTDPCKTKINNTQLCDDGIFIFIGLSNSSQFTMETRGAAEAQVEVTINKPGKILHFSDGVDEIIEEETQSDLNNEPVKDDVDPKTLPWGPWFNHYAWKSSNRVLNAVDYAGESLANFFGITTPKYQIEIDEYERIKEEKKKIEEDSAGWVPKDSGGDIPLVLNEPVKDLDNPAKI